MAEKKKSLFDKAVDALTNRDEKDELEQAKMAAEAASKEAAALKKKMAADKAAADKAAAEKKASEIAAKQKAVKEAAAKRIALTKEANAKAAALREAAKPKKGVVVTRSLRVRKDHNTDAAIVAGLDEGNEVSILETWTDGKNVWAKIAEGQWAAMVYDGQTLMKFA